MDERQDSWESTHFTAVGNAYPPSCGADSDDVCASEDADPTSEVGLLTALQWPGTSAGSDRARCQSQTALHAGAEEEGA